MPDGEGGGGEGGGNSEFLPMDDLVEAMLRNSQALADALAADRARREAADRMQRESWEAALKEKDAEIERVRAEAAEAKKKLQADASRKRKWEAAYELLLGANQKLAELRDADVEDSRTCVETLHSKEVESCTKRSHNPVDHTASNFRKLKHDYETLRSKKAKEVSALLSENGSLRSQLDIKQQDNVGLLKNKKVEAAQALKLQKSVDELKMLAQKKDDEIARLQAEAVEAKKEHDKDLSALLSEKYSVYSQLRLMQKDYTELLKSKKVLNRKKDHDIVILRAEAVGAKKKVQQMHFLVKEKDDEIQRLKAVTVRDKLKNSDLRRTVEEDYMSETKKVDKDGQEETTQKPFVSNDDEMSRSDEDDDKQIGSDKDGDKQSGSNEDCDEQSRRDEDGDERSRNGDDDDDDHGQSRSDEHVWDEPRQSGIDGKTTNNPIQKPPRNPKRKRDACSAETSDDTSDTESNGVANWRWSYSPPQPLRSRRLVISLGRRSMISTGNWAQFVSDVRDILADKPRNLKIFHHFLRGLKKGDVSRYIVRILKDMLEGHLIRRLDNFLPNDIARSTLTRRREDPDEQPHREQLSSASAAAGLIKLVEAEQQPKRELV